MHKLIMKDILIQRSILHYIILYIPFALFLLKNVNSSGLYLIISMTVAYLMLTNSFSLEEKSQSEKVVLSLPVSRKEIVLSKYISLFIYAAMSMALMSIIGFILNMLSIKNSGLNYISMSEIKAIFTSCIIIGGILLPLQLKLGYTKARFANIIVYILIYSLIPILLEYFNDYPIKQIVYWYYKIGSTLGSWIFIALLGVFLLASYFLSLNYFEKREF